MFQHDKTTIHKMALKGFCYILKQDGLCFYIKVWETFFRVPTKKAWMMVDNLRFFIWGLEHHIYQRNGCSKCCSRQPYEEILHKVLSWGKINLFTPFCLYLHKTDIVTESCINILLWQYLFMPDIVITTKGKLLGHM